MRMAKFVPVERGSRRDAAKASVDAAADALRSGLHMLVFPEGTRSLDGRLSTFKKGPFFLAQETQAPIIPVAISGTQTMMRKGSSAITPGLARIQMLPAIDPTDYATREELMRAVRNAIAEAPAAGDEACGLLDDGVVAVCLEALPHGVGVFLGREGPDLHMEKLVLRLMPDRDVVAPRFSAVTRTSASS